ncbi:TPA: hypothetical protein ACH3X3_001338 [Trebouxia sp. C0006]
MRVHLVTTLPTQMPRCGGATADKAILKAGYAAVQLPEDKVPDWPTQFCWHQNRDAYGRHLPEVEEQVQSGSQVVKAGRHQPAQHECAVGCCGTGWNVTESLAMRSW